MRCLRKWLLTRQFILTSKQNWDPGGIDPVSLSRKRRGGVPVRVLPGHTRGWVGVGGIFCIVLTLTPVTLTHWREVYDVAHCVQGSGQRRNGYITAISIGNKTQTKHNTTENTTKQSMLSIVVTLCCIRKNKYSAINQEDMWGHLRPTSVCLPSHVYNLVCVCVWAKAEYLAVFLFKRNHFSQKKFSEVESL